RFDRLQQSRKRNRKNKKEKIRPACLPNRQQVSCDKKSKNKDWCGATAGRADFSFSNAKPNKKRGDEKQVPAPAQPDRICRPDVCEFANGACRGFENLDGMQVGE